MAEILALGISHYPPLHGPDARMAWILKRMLQNPKLPAYWVVNLHSSYKISDNVEVFGLVRNLFNQHYAVAGTFFDVASYPYLNLTDPRTFIPGIPFAAYVGVRGTLPSAGPAFAAETSRPIITKTAPVSSAAGATPAAVDWTGIYLGVNGGFTFGGSDWRNRSISLRGGAPCVGTSVT